jgi:hypothetical protein
MLTNPRLLATGPPLRNSHPPQRTRAMCSPRVSRFVFAQVPERPGNLGTTPAARGQARGGARGQAQGRVQCQPTPADRGHPG